MSRPTVNQRAVNPRSIRWDRRAKCLGLDPNLFYPQERETEKAARAKQICAECAVRLECLEEALANREHGIWGGTSTAERTLIRRARREKRD